MTNLPECSFYNGRTIRASYHKDLDLPGHVGNPLLEALGPLIDDETELEAMLLNDVVFPAHVHKLSQGKRRHWMRLIETLFQPFSPHLDLEQRISLMLRGGLIHRNPTHHEYWANLDAIAERGAAALPAARMEFSGAWTSTTTALGLIGLSGTGKTRALERILWTLYPQVIRHREYNERPFIMDQLVWLKISLPPDGSTKGLLLNIVQAIDVALGTSYYQEYTNNGKYSKNTIMGYVRRLIFLHGIGLIVIDEIQRLEEAKSGGKQEVLNFCTELADLGASVIFVGTPKALPTLYKNLHLSRRLAGEGYFPWDRLEGKTWQAFCRTIERYQCLNHAQSFDDTLMEALQKVSQGVIAIAVKVFIRAQIWAMADGTETLTAQLIQDVFDEDFRVLHLLVEAIAGGDSANMHEFEDVLPSLPDLYTPPSRLAAARPQAPLLASSNAPIHQHHPPTLLPANTPVPNTPRKSRRRVPIQADSLLAIVARGKEQGKLGYLALREAGCIGSATEFFEEAA